VVFCLVLIAGSKALFSTFRTLGSMRSLIDLMANVRRDAFKVANIWSRIVWKKTLPQLIDNVDNIVRV